MEELILRIKALLRRVNRESESAEDKRFIAVGDCLIDLNRRVFIRGDEEIPVSRRMWDLIAYLARNRGRVVEKRELLEKVWYDAYVTEDVIRAYIKELRKILPPNSIETFKGRGYRLK
ncbi:winged helix-turn-helix domain-containing protein [Thermodesulforhabdus norvegica]|uniref:Transcriptional regulatory protein, C terminal n=1 Tax=Thermodesulforhabdus norvegica TaxID=39841 RepID=A0A1I4RD94_9BACT|nr:winged helix-turn-helix domain-containing protein [Thermodesulforhabdus norvegica]SFM50244.1 Transcriptional regulatory protein, C terminal [Thermodesulforhabdus norvegica]